MRSVQQGISSHFLFAYLFPHNLLSSLGEPGGVNQSAWTFFNINKKFREKKIIVGRTIFYLLDLFLVAVSLSICL
jgi:hypothetical protein